MLVPVTVPRRFHIIAHRGASGYAPENTAAAFDLAFRLGAHEVETDAQLSADGEVVLCHDRTLERYGHGGAAVESLEWSTLKLLDMGAWFSPHLYGGQRMLLLHELVEMSPPDTVFHVELKGQHELLPHAVYRALDRHNVLDRCVVTSFSERHLAVMREIDSGVRLGWLVERCDAAVLTSATRAGLHQLCPRARFIDAEVVSTARNTVREVRAWGVSGSSREVAPLLDALVGSGCDGTTLNWPDWAVTATAT